MERAWLDEQVACVLCRSGGVQAEDLEQLYGEDVDFLFTKLKIAQEGKHVRELVNGR